MCVEGLHRQTNEAGGVSGQDLRRQVLDAQSAATPRPCGPQDGLRRRHAGRPRLARQLGYRKEWNESSRYARKTKAEAEDLYEAITDNKHGVLSWLKPRW